MSATRGTDEAGERGYPRSRFGHTDLPMEQASALRRAVRLEIATLAFLVAVRRARKRPPCSAARRRKARSCCG